MGEKCWCVVQFEDGLQVVPQTWINGDRCYWPSFSGTNSNQLYLRAVRSYKEPDEDGWPLYEVRILGVYDTIEKSFKKLKLAEEQSDINSEDDSKSKRALKKRKVFVDTDDEEDEEDTLRFGIIQPFPIPESETKRPIKTKCLEEAKGSHHSKNKKISLFNKEQEEAALNFHPSTPGCSKTMEESDEITLPTYSDDAFKKHVIECLSSIKIKLDKLTQAVAQSQTCVCKNRNKQVVEEDVENNIFDNFPCVNEEDLQKCEEKCLVTPAYKQTLISQLSRVGGYKLDEIVKSILKKLFTNKLASKYNWEGKKGKKAFSILAFSEIILKAVRSSPNFKDVNTDKEIIECIKNWLRHASARDINNVKKKTAENATEK